MLTTSSGRFCNFYADDELCEGSIYKNEDMMSVFNRKFNVDHESDGFSQNRSES